MASSSSSSTVASSGSSYDVFLSFRGEDTRNSFTDHLYKALVRAGFRTFRDNDAIDRGQDLKPEIERAITVSRASIVVLSENYANSTWCLDELLLILEKRKNSNHLVLPVFYHVDPSDVRKQQKSFADAFSMRVNAGVEGSQTSVKWMEKADRWKVALTNVADLTGMVLSGPETNFITDIVNTIGRKLDRKLVSTPCHLTGMDTRSKDINSWLKIKQPDAEVLAICGMGGSGKTTLAKYIYNSNSRKFESSSFLEDIKKSCEQPHGLLELQKQLLTDILGNKKIKISNVSERTIMIEEALQTKKVLIVLDDIDKVDELAALLGTQKFNTESKIIITTRDLETHAWFESTSRRCRKYTLKLLNDNESLKLLSWHAFGSEIPMEGFKELAVQVAQYCAGNPLALKVLGSSLFVSAEDLRKGNNIESWTSTLNLLTKDTHSGIQGILQRSFDSLPYKSCKELFLHIASFFIGVDKDYVVKILETDYSASAGIVILVNRSLLTVSPSNKLMMHQLLQEMGKTIIREESKDPARRSRVWCSQESYAILKRGEGSKTIEGLSLDMRMLEKQTLKSCALKTDSFTEMKKLKLLQLKYVQFTGSYENFPKDLTWLCWHGFNLRTAPLDLFMGNLVAIDMSYSNLVLFEVPVVLNSLKILNLKDSQQLVKIHNIFNLPNIETLILWNCSSLADVCETIGDLENLILLDMTGCENLWKVFLKAKHINPPEGLKASDFGRKCAKLPFSLPHSLKRLLLNNCNLELNYYFHMDFSALSFLQYLNVGNNPFDLLPNYNNLTNLRVLDLTFCQRVKFLLCLPNTLEELYIYYCVSLEKITFQSAQFRLREIGYGGCLNLTEIQGLFNLVPIEKLDETDLGHLMWLRAYQSHEVGLIGDEITEGRSSHIQILYEFGIMSTFLPDIKDPNMVSENMSRSPFLSFLVPLCPKSRRLQGLNVTFVYRLSGEEEHVWALFAKISNITKDQNWIYNPIVFGKPEVGKNTVWLSYWAIGNILDIGDEVNVSIVVGNGMEVSECGASLVYIDDVEKEILQTNVEREEVLGGDLSAFQLSTGGYYLCRRDFFESKEIDETTPDWFKILFGDTVDYTEVQGWSKFGRSQQRKASFTEVETYRCITYGPDLDETYNKQTVDMSTASAAGKSVESTISVPTETMKSAITSESRVSTTHKIVYKVNFDGEEGKAKVMKAVSKLEGVESIAVDTREGTLTVIGRIDHKAVSYAVRLTGHSAQIVNFETTKKPDPSPPDDPIY